jgi:hypothetical protein
MADVVAVMQGGTKKDLYSAKELAGSLKEERKFRWGLINPNIPYSAVHPTRANMREVTKIKEACSHADFTVNLGGRIGTMDSPSWAVVQRMKFWSSNDAKYVAHRNMLKRPVLDVQIQEPAVSSGAATSWTVMSLEDCGVAGGLSGMVLDEGHNALVTVISSPSDKWERMLGARDYAACIFFLPSGIDCARCSIRCVSRSPSLVLSSMLFLQGTVSLPTTVPCLTTWRTARCPFCSWEAHWTVRNSVPSSLPCLPSGDGSAYQSPSIQGVKRPQGRAPIIRMGIIV